MVRNDIKNKKKWALKIPFKLLKKSFTITLEDSQKYQFDILQNSSKIVEFLSLYTLLKFVFLFNFFVLKRRMSVISQLKHKAAGSLTF